MCQGTEGCRVFSGRVDGSKNQVKETNANQNQGKRNKLDQPSVQADQGYEVERQTHTTPIPITPVLEGFPWPKQ